MEVEAAVFTDELDVGCEREKTQKCLQGVWPGACEEIQLLVADAREAVWLEFSLDLLN